MTKRTFAIIDSGITLRNGIIIKDKRKTPKYNTILLDSLKKKGIRDIYLLQKDGTQKDSCYDQQLIRYLKEQQFNVHGILVAKKTTEDDQSLERFSKTETLLRDIKSIIVCDTSEEACDELHRSMPKDNGVGLKYVQVTSTNFSNTQGYEELNELPDFAPEKIQAIVNRINNYINTRLGPSFFKKSPEPYVKAFKRLIIMLETQYSENVTFRTIYSDWYSRDEELGGHDTWVSNGAIIEIARGALTPLYGQSSAQNFAEGLFDDHKDNLLSSTNEFDNRASVFSLNDSIYR